MSDEDVQRALKTLRRHGYDVDPDSRKLITLADNHIYMRSRSTVGGNTVERAVAIPLLPTCTDVGDLVQMVFAILDEEVGDMRFELSRDGSESDDGDPRTPEFGVGFEE